MKGFIFIVSFILFFWLVIAFHASRQHMERPVKSISKPIRP